MVHKNNCCLNLIFCNSRGLEERWSRLINQFHVGFFGFLDQKWLLPGIYCDSTSLEVEVASTKDFHTSPHKSTLVASTKDFHTFADKDCRPVDTKVTGRPGRPGKHQIGRFWRQIICLGLNIKNSVFGLKKKHAHHIHCHPCLVDLTPPCARSGDFLPIM